MRAVIQRVSEASCMVNDSFTGVIGTGLLIFLGIEDIDSRDDLEWLAAKIVNMRIFSDDQGMMNKALVDIDGEILLISQFTLFASTRKGNRPGFAKAARPDKAIPLYEMMISRLEALLDRKVKVGVFGADMKIRLLNDGPVTILIDSHRKE